ncbi:alpha/beta-hydrolase [Acephala macrosclerotiorum]|nr:alpha/beta-hydrolase [Acephala macrosclerotiorum]
MVLKLCTVWMFWGLAGLGFSLSLPRSDAPTAKVGDATYAGLTDSNYGVEIWAGIRFAKPPLGPLRLQPPQPYKASGTIQSQEFGHRCFEIGSGISPGQKSGNNSEDCLVLNVYAPSQSTSGKRWLHQSPPYPVMFYLYGGGFNQGSGNDYHGQSLVNHSVELKSPVIVVTINYRLSFFGFSAGTDAIANNALNLGLLDQRFALQWVHDNIAAFGGDPNKVTLFGQSAGATSTGLQMTAYNGAHQNLFRAAILESGSPSDTLPTPPPTWPVYQAAWDAVVALIGCNTSANVFQCVQAADSGLLFAAVNEVGANAPLPDSIWPWQPVVDGKFVADFPSKLTAAGKFTKVPMIIGFTTDEITYAIPTTFNLSSDLSILGLHQATLPFIDLAVFEKIVALDPLSVYPNTEDVGGTEWKRVTEIASDIFERCPGREWVRNVTKWNAIIPAQLAEAPYEHIVHSAEIPYVWGPSLIPGAITTSLDIQLSLQAQKAWISFASFLDPNTLGDLSSGVRWPSYQLHSENVLVFQRPDGSGEQANGTAGTPVGEGLHKERDPDDRPICDFYAANDAAFVH